MTTAKDIETRTSNSYDFVRFFAASCVLFSHHFDLAGFNEPNVPGLGQDFGDLGVEIFFCLSGFLICLSLRRSTDWVRFIAARFFRIFPNLLFVLIATSLVTLAWYRNSANLGAHVSYVADNLMMFWRGVTQIIPGVFANAEKQDINDPLWTLPYELWLYVVLALLFLVGRRCSGFAIIAAALVFGLCWSLGALDIDIDALDFDVDFTIGPFESEEIFRLGSYFLSGAVLAVAWPWIGKHAVALGLAGLAATFAVRNLLPVETLLTTLALAAAVVGLGSARTMAWFAKGGDASYGMYVFAWPVQQFALLLVGAFWPSMMAAFLVTVAIGYATWHAFERRAMTYPARIARYFRRGAPSD